MCNKINKQNRIQNEVFLKTINDKVRRNQYKETNENNPRYNTFLD